MLLDDTCLLVSSAQDFRILLRMLESVFIEIYIPKVFLKETLKFLLSGCFRVTRVHFDSDECVLVLHRRTTLY